MVSGTNDRYLQKGVAIRRIYEKLEPNLIWGDFVEGPIQEDRASFAYLYDSAGISGDSKKQTAPRHIGGADLPRIDFSMPSTNTALTEAKGFELAIPRKIVRDGITGKAAIDRYYKKASYVLVEQLNTAILAAIRAGAGAATGTPTAVWSAATTTPVTDMMDFAMEMDVEGYPYRLTDGFVNKAGFYELKEYLNFYDGTQFIDGRPVGKMINQDTIYVAAADCTVHKVMSGTTDGEFIGLCNFDRGAEIHTYNDPEFAIEGAKISYPTVENGKKVNKTAPNLGIHFYSYMENDTKDTILQFWFENKTVVTQSLALQKNTGI